LGGRPANKPGGEKKKVVAQVCSLKALFFLEGIIEGHELPGEEVLKVKNHFSHPVGTMQGEQQGKKGSRSKKRTKKIRPQ